LGELVLVASWIDAQKCRKWPLVYVEHGSGQTYQDGPQEGYSGSQGLSHVRLFVCPGEHVAGRWQATYPLTPVAVAGCPALDQHLRAERHPDPMVELHVEGMRAALRASEAPLVALSSHWRCGVVSETYPALPLYEKQIAELTRDPSLRLVGHAHPRSTWRTRAMWDRLGIRYEPDPDVILSTANLLVVDNSSLAYEAAACGIPVLSLNRPSYRRDVEHGLRFWSHVPGMQCDRPEDFAGAVKVALDDPPEARALRERAVEHVYAHRDGTSAARAVDAIETVI
jgi:hypothetical protein